MPIRHLKQFGMLLGDGVGADISFKSGAAIHQVLVEALKIDKDLPLSREDLEPSLLGPGRSAIEL